MNFTGTMKNDWIHNIHIQESPCKCTCIVLQNFQARLKSLFLTVKCKFFRNRPHMLRHNIMIIKWNKLLKFWQPKRTRKKRVPIQAASAEEAIYKVIHERKISNKINYDVLNDLKCQSGLQSVTPVDSQLPPTPLQTEDLPEASRSGYIKFFYCHKCDLLLYV